MSEQVGTTKEKVMGKINEIKSNIETFVDGINVSEIKGHINTLVRDAQKDFSKIVDKDLADMKKKLQKEKADIEAKAKKFLDGHKKEINALQARLDKIVKATSKMKAAAPKAAATSKKKATKKVAKVVKTVKKAAKK